jgi:hypothetical protein
MILIQRGGRQRPGGANAIRGVVADTVVSSLAIALGLLSGCQTPAEKQATHNAEINLQATVEINRICALPEDQREAELKKIKDQSGMVLYCGSK